MNFFSKFKRFSLSSVVGLLTLSITHIAHAAPSQLPLFLTAPVKPIVMLNMSKDHQLFYKAYDDYSDLDGDGKPDTTFKPSYPYYGYFDYKKCYVYLNGLFSPVKFSSEGLCNTGSTTNEWSGNFLNWATMTRIDAVRKVLYGGKRSTDTKDTTILERALIPEDAHAFAKYYNGEDLKYFAPFPAQMAGKDDAKSGITICNTTSPTTRVVSQNVTSAPLMKVATGNYALWASAEGWQCRWGIGSSDNDHSITGMRAYSNSPSEGQKLSELNVRVKVCGSSDLIDEDNDENCRPYASGKFKPSGVLQEYGEDGSIQFGLITGSYGKNKSGGVLRKNTGDMTNEIDLTDGTFKASDIKGSIVKTLDALTVVGYNYSNGQYNNTDNCPWALSLFANGACRNWGNPQSEIYLEALRYLSGQSATTAFASNDSAILSDLKSPSWTKPVTNDNYCAPLNIIQFNASVSSYDGDDLSGASGVGIDYVAATNKVGSLEGFSGEYFIGSNGTDNNQLCSPKAFTTLANMKGTCPDAPRLDGTYHIAGLAHHARSQGITLSGTGNKKQVVQTFGVALAPAVPKVEVIVPGSDKTVTIMPACRNKTPNPNGNCAIVDFKIIEQKTVNNVEYGSLYVNWEDSEQGGDYDQDMWGIIKYEVSAEKAVVKTQVVAMSASHVIGFGYVISGTTDDGFHVMSGINGFSYNTTGFCSNASVCHCRSNGTFGRCDHASSSLRSKTHTIGPSTAKSLEQPLYYAAKWGGYPKALEEQAKKDGVPLESLVDKRDVSDSYFFATNPRILQESLKSAFGRVAAQVGAASTAATSSSRLNDDSQIYQAKFNSTNWDGTLQVLKINNKQVIEEEGLSTDKQFVDKVGFNPATRKIFTNVNGALKSFQWVNLSDTQKSFLDEDNLGERRVNWIRGVDEPGMRERANYLGDIVNSNPVYSGRKTPRYELLPGDAGSSYKSLDEASGVIYVGANDGMLHAFDAKTLTELFAFIPNAAYSKLAALTVSDYGTETNPHQFIVDGELYVSDVYVGGGWKRYLVGSMGAGGRAIFGLDVTIPTDPKLLFEFSYADYPELGYGMVKPTIAPFQDGNWYAVFGNGSEGGRSSLFVVNLASPNSATIVKATEGAGITSLALLPNGKAQIGRIYAGDLSGNIWRFDTVGNASSWAVKHKLFQAKDKQNNIQPITGGITLGGNSFLKNAIMVYFGTGKYFDSGDNSTSATPVHSIYAIADMDAPLTGSRALLFHEKDFSESSGTRKILNERVTEDGKVSHAVDWSTKKGWFMDFDMTHGERVIAKPMLVVDRLIFPTITPSGTACDYGGSSWMMELVAVGDKNVNHSVLGDTGNSIFDGMVVGDLLILVDGNGGLVISTDIAGETSGKDADLTPEFRGRMNWREIR